MMTYKPKKVLLMVLILVVIFMLVGCDDEANEGMQNEIDILKEQVTKGDEDFSDLKEAFDLLIDDFSDMQAKIDAFENTNQQLTTDLIELDASLQHTNSIIESSKNALEEQFEVLLQLERNELTTAFQDEILLLEETVIEDLSLLESELDILLSEMQVLIETDFNSVNQNIDSLTIELDNALAETEASITNLANELVVYENPFIYGIEYYEIRPFEELHHSLYAFDIQDGDITDSLIPLSETNFSLPGVYFVTYQVTDSDLNVNEKTVEVLVSLPEPVLANYPEGVDFSKLDGLNKGRIYTALERYLLENVIGGVPLYTSANREIYSSRVNLFSETYNGVLGFGESLSQLVEDDSSVLFSEGTYGNVGEYTWRDTYFNNLSTLNPWIAEESENQEMINLFTGYLYKMQFDESKTGFQLSPSLASGEPIPADPQMIDGRIYSTTWKIPIKENLTWAYHQDTDTSMYSLDHEVLNAEDFVWTYKYVLENELLRAISTGNDFITKGIINAQEFIDGTVSWENVGIKEVDSMIEFSFQTPQTAFDIKYVTSMTWSPLHEDMVTTLGVNYGKSPESVASSGAYILTSWDIGETVSFSKNNAYVDANMYHYTGLLFRQVVNHDHAFSLFEEGFIDNASVPASRVSEFLDDSRVKAAPNNTVYKMMINGFGTEENRDEYINSYPDMGIDATHTPEPILMYKEMKQALYYGFDRVSAIEESNASLLPAFTYFPSTYFIDAESGLSIRGYTEGKELVEDFGMGSFGYSSTIAKAYFLEAVAQSIEDGYYQKGTPQNYTVIELKLNLQNVINAEIQAFFEQLEIQYETLFVDDVNYIKVEIVPITIENYYSYPYYLLTASFDLAIGGISGSLLCPCDFFETFRDDNAAGFTMNYGIDTSSVTLPVLYETVEGTGNYELWSYNALSSSIYQKTYIQDGLIQTSWNSNTDLIEAYLGLENDIPLTFEEGIILAEYLLGNTLEEVSDSLGVEQVHATIVTREHGEDTLFIVSENLGQFTLVDLYPLSLSAEGAIKAHSGYPDYYINSTGPMTNEDVGANDYLTSLSTGYSTVAEYLVEYSALEYGELWEVQWNGWDDVYIVLHIGDYYIGWVWL